MDFWDGVSAVLRSRAAIMKYRKRYFVLYWDQKNVCFKERLTTPFSVDHICQIPVIDCGEALLAILVQHH
jgi:hypothetical protein